MLDTARHDTTAGFPSVLTANPYNSLASLQAKHTPSQIPALVGTSESAGSDGKETTSRREGIYF